MREAINSNTFMNCVVSRLLFSIWGVSISGFDYVAFNSGWFSELCLALGPTTGRHDGRIADDSLSMVSH
jgi:hypothetical protein